MRNILLTLLTALLLTSCEYKDLCYDHSHWATVKVTFNWEKEPNATAKGMTVIFYNLDDPTAEPIRYDLPLEGGTVRLVAGRYRALTYNNDTETILYRGNDYGQTVEAYTRESSIEEGTRLTRAGMPRAPGTEREKVILEPDPLWGCLSQTFTLQEDDRDVSLVLYPEHRYNTITVTIINVPNLQYSGSFAGAMSGLSEARWMATGIPSDILASQAFEAYSVSGTTIQMKFRVFGHCPHEKGKHIFTVYAILADGSQWYYTMDVTEKMHDSAATDKDENINITIDGLPVPKPIVNGSGFQPTIDGWQGEEIEITM